ncbi:two pore segment channel 2 [Clonorchis sinensis]|uniref:Two pore segment channel 2 n=1 Tax=Clonorchis sinensis TaxID=79923 RepID=H2KVH8_CLOSI|nr:two pore segment channel 2 [Clonorchis sinensis]
MAISILFLLPLFEWPSSLTLSSDIRKNAVRPRLPCGVTESVELMCLLVILLESICLCCAFERSWVKRNPWLLGRFVVFSIYLADLSVSLAFSCNEFHRIRRFLRPYFLISNSQLMKKLLKCLRRTLPKLLSTLFLLLLWLVCASMVALCVFSGRHHTGSGAANSTDSSSSFPDFYRTMINLLVLTTTANHPDVLVGMYNQNRATAIFSIVFLGLGLYVLMNILTAIIYSEFRGYMLSSVQARLTRRRLAIRAAFEVLAILDHRSDLVRSDRLIELLDSINISSWKKEALREVYVSNFGESDLNVTQFMQLFRTLDLSSPRFTSDRLPPVSSRFAQFLQAWLVSYSFYKLSIAVSFLNIVNLAIDISSHLKSPGVSVQLRITSWCFVAFYLLEQCGLMWAYGVKPFFSKLSNVFNLIVVLFLLIAKLIELAFLIYANGKFPTHLVDFPLWDIVNITNILLLMRAVRLVNIFVWTSLVTSVLKDLPRNLAPVLGILLSVYYVYALLGMSLFHGVIVYNANSSSTENLQCGTYQQLQYWSINFDDFAASIVLLWDLMVVNNWHVIVTAYQQTLNNWIHLYMISWWLIAPVGLLSLVTAFVIESFLHRRDLYTKAIALANHPKEVVHVSGNPTLDLTVGPSKGLSVNPSRTASSCSHRTETFSEPIVYGTTPVTVFQPERYEETVFTISTSSLDDLFRAALQEPSEDELLLQLKQHKQLQRQLRAAQFANTVVQESTD